jgi:hypothetical protein
MVCGCVCSSSWIYVGGEVALRALSCRLLLLCYAQSSWVVGVDERVDLMCIEGEVGRCEGVGKCFVVYYRWKMHQRLRRPKLVIWHTDVAASQTKQTLGSSINIQQFLGLHNRDLAIICIHYLHRLSFRSRFHSSVLSACNVIQRPLEMSSWVV